MSPAPSPSNPQPSATGTATIDAAPVGRGRGELRVPVRDGATVTVATCINDRDEAETTARWIVAMHAAGAGWRDLLVVAPGKRKWRDRLGIALAAAAVPHRMLLGEPGALPAAGDDVVHVASLYGAEGWSSPQVAIVGLGDLPWKQQPLDEALRIVAATVVVATRGLHVCRSRPSALVERVFPDGSEQGSRHRHIALK